MRTTDSRVPIGMTVGFGIGLAVGAVLFHGPRQTPPEKPVQPDAEVRPGKPLSVVPNLPTGTTTLAEIELLFRTWGGYAVWENNLSQFAVMDPDDRSEAYYEVRRANRLYYFRLLPKADWPLIDHGIVARCPLWFAEPKAARDEFYRLHPDEKPGVPIRQSVGPRAPLLPSVAPGTGAESEPSELKAPSPTPDGTDTRLVPPWEAPAVTPPK